MVVRGRKADVAVGKENGAVRGQQWQADRRSSSHRLHGLHKVASISLLASLPACLHLKALPSSQNGICTMSEQVYVTSAAIDQATLAGPASFQTCLPSLAR